MGGSYNTVYQRMMERVGSDEGQVPLVLACVAYSIYKNEKRQWITDWTNQNGVRPSDEQIDYYVSTWNDLSIERTFAAAKVEIESFAEAVFESSKEDLSSEVYQALFKSLADKIEGNRAASDDRADNIVRIINEKTKSNWAVSAISDIFVSIIANFIWFVLTIVILVGLYVNFDLGRFVDKAKTLFSQQEYPSESRSKN